MILSTQSNSLLSYSNMGWLQSTGESVKPLALGD